jgi:hypothetical protein
VVTEEKRYLRSAVHTRDDGDVVHIPGFDGGLELLDSRYGTLSALARQSEQSLVVDPIGYSITHREEVIVVFIDCLHLEPLIHEMAQQLIAAPCTVDTERFSELFGDSGPFTFDNDIRECDPTAAAQHPLSFRDCG